MEMNSIYDIEQDTENLFDRRITQTDNNYFIADRKSITMVFSLSCADTISRPTLNITFLSSLTQTQPHTHISDDL